MMRTVIFDLDGTLADTAADLVAAANGYFTAEGLGAPLDPLRDARTAHRGGKAMLRLGFERTRGAVDEARVAAAYPQLLAIYSDALCRETQLYPGAAEAVTALRADGIATGICTNKPVALADRLLVTLGVRELFGSLVGQGTLTVVKPDAAPLMLAIAEAGGTPARALLVGDTDTDRKTAAAAGVPSVLVTFGPEGHSVTDLAPEAVIGHFRDLPDVVRALLP